MLRLILPLLAILLFSGCEGSLQQLIRKPGSAADDNNAPGQVGTVTFAVGSDRRLAFSHREGGEFCAEPPHEAAEQISQSIAAALQGIDAKAGKESNGTHPQTVERLYRRAHTLQLFRDAAFFLCVNALNQSATKTDPYSAYQESVRQLIEQLHDPLMEEIRLYYQAEQSQARNPSSANEVIVCSPARAAGSKSGVSCQRLIAPSNRNPAVIDPPLLPTAPANRPVM